MSIAAKLDQFMRDMKTQNRARIAEATAIYKQSLHETLGDQGDAKHPSRPGEAPHRVTGQLQSSIVSEVDEANTTSRTGTAASYTEHLLAKRNYYRIAYEKVASPLRKTLLER